MLVDAICASPPKNTLIKLFLFTIESQPLVEMFILQTEAHVLQIHIHCSSYTNNIYHSLHINLVNICTCIMQIRHQLEYNEFSRQKQIDT